MAARKKTPTPRYLAALLIQKALFEIELASDSERIEYLEGKANTRIAPKKFSAILQQYEKLASKLRDRCHTLVVSFEKPTE